MTSADRSTFLEPCPIDLPPPRAGEPRIAELLGTSAGATPAAVIVGFPVDEGVRRNGGRPGAAAAPAAIRRALLRMTCDPRMPAMESFLRRCVDLGDLVATGDLEADQQLLGRAIAPHLAAGRLAIVLGGGHETAFGTFLGHVAAGEAISIVNLDAHPDVRPTQRVADREEGHSGSPFRQAIEHASGRCRGYAVAGLQPSAVSAEALRWLRERGCDAAFIDEPGVAEDPLGALPPWRGGNATLPIMVMASLDLDAVAAAAAPGVSAPSPAGLSPQVWLAAAERLGADPRVRSIDLVELCPRLDLGELTTRLAGLTVWRILRGAAGRPG